MKRVIWMMAAVALLVGGVGQAKADFVYDASGTFTDGIPNAPTYTLSGKVTFDSSGGLVSADLLVKSSDGKTTYLDTSVGHPTVSLGSITALDGTTYDELDGDTSNHQNEHFELTLPFLQSEIGGNSITLLPNVDLGNNTGFTGDFSYSNLTPPFIVNASAPLASGELALESTTTAAPEPASLTLLGISALCTLGYGWRRRKPAQN